MTSDDTFNATIVVGIAIVTNRCDSAVDLVGVNHPEQDHGLSSCGRKVVTARWWWSAINTTPITPFNGTQAFQLLHSLQRAKLHSKTSHKA
jgi:hypothetical protein